MQIPFINLQRQYESIKTEIDHALRDAVQDFQFSKGKRIADFEERFAAMLGIKHCIATGNGTDSLFIALKVSGITRGDEVLTPAFSWISTAETISLCGATPVFTDVDPLTFVIDPVRIEERITARTKAVIAVHLYGQPAAMETIMAICRRNNFVLIEDCAQAHLSQLNGKFCGTFGNISAFSFYPTKNLGAYGEAGCLVTDDDQIAMHIRRFANHGALKKDDHLIEGMNSRMDAIQAAILLAKLPHLRSWTDRRIENATLYSEMLKEIPEVTTPVLAGDALHTYHLYVIRAQKRNELQAYLEGRGIQTLVHYPQALPYLPAYAYMKQKPENFSVSNALQDEVLSLPVYPELTREEILYVAQKIKDFYRKQG